MPGWLMPRFYRHLAARLARDGEVRFHPMPERRGLGRTDRVVDAFRPLIEDAGARGEEVRIAGHSLGGIVAWVLALDYPEVVRSAELWCAPIRGTSVGRTRAPFPELRFLSRGSRWLRRYERPICGPFVRAVYTPLDPLAVPALDTCHLEGETVENHVVTPLARRVRRDNEVVHRGVGDHVLLPRLRWLNEALADHDARRDDAP